MATYILSKYQLIFDIIHLVRIQNVSLFTLLFVYFVIYSHSSQIRNIDKNISQNFAYYNESRTLRNERSLPSNNDNFKQSSESIENSSLPTDQIEGREFREQIYGKFAFDENTRREQLAQMTAWLSNEDSIMFADETTHVKENNENQSRDTKSIEKLNDKKTESGDFGTAEPLKAEKLKTQRQQQVSEESSQSSKQIQTQSSHLQNHKTEAEEGDEAANHNYDPHEEDNGPSGTTKTPQCANHGRYYCSFKEDYPIKVVTEIMKYYKWPLEKLFRDLRHQVMPTLANDNSGALVCDSITRIIRAGWAKNTNGRWLVVINTDHYQQYITEVICRHGSGSYCNFIPPCYHASCRQRYNTQKLLVIDPWNPYKGPFLSEFLFPSCCVCYIPGDEHDSKQSASTAVRDKFTGTHSNHHIVSDKSSSASPIEVSSLPTAKID